MANTIGPKIAVVDSIPDGAVYGDDGRAFLRMFQALIMPNVINMTTAAAPSSPTNGDMYVVASIGSGAWTGKTNYVAYWSTNNPDAPSGEWEFYQPLAGWIVVNRANNTQYLYNGSTWSAVSGGGGASLSVATTTLNTAQVMALQVTPGLIIAAPGAGKVLVPVSVFMQIKQGGVTFNAPLSGPIYAFQYGNATDTSATQFSTLSGAGIADPDGELVINGTIDFDGYTNNTALVNLGLYLWNTNTAGSDPTLGNGSIVLTVTYYTQTLA